MWNLYVEFVRSFCPEKVRAHLRHNDLSVYYWELTGEGESAVYYGEMTGEGDSAPGGSYWVAHP